MVTYKWSLGVGRIGPTQHSLFDSRTQAKLDLDDALLTYRKSGHNVNKWLRQFMWIAMSCHVMSHVTSDKTNSGTGQVGSIETNSGSGSSWVYRNEQWNRVKWVEYMGGSKKKTGQVSWNVSESLPRFTTSSSTNTCELHSFKYIQVNKFTIIKWYKIISIIRKWRL